MGLWRCQHSRGDKFGEPLPAEDGDKARPEEFHALFLEEDPFAAVQSVEQLYGGKQARENHVSGIDKEGAHYSWAATSGKIETCEREPTAETVAHELAPNERENSHSGVGLDTIVEVVGRKDANSERGASGSARKNCDCDVLFHVYSRS